MKIERYIKLSEQKFIPSLELFFRSVYDDKKYPSHGIDHHRRVWNYAREILQTIHQDEINDPQLFIDKLLIACYLHDSGMAVEPGEKHGFESRKVCEVFLSNNNLKNSDYKDVLNAIENHDKKEYQITETDDKLLLILSVADDLDAFGYIGIYRYIEIYLVRGIKAELLAEVIRNNARKRFENFENKFRAFPELVNKHKARFKLIDDFFNKEIYQKNKPDPYSQLHSVYYSIIDRISINLKSEGTIFSFLSNDGNGLNDPLLPEFIENLNRELDFSNV